MAKVIRHESSLVQATTTATAPLPTNLEDDLIIVFATQNGLVTSAFTIDQSFTIADQDYFTSRGRICVAYKVAGSGGESTAPIVTSTLSDEWVVSTVIVRGVDTADIFNQVVTTAATETTDHRIDMPTVTTDETKCLVFNYSANLGSLRDITPEFQPDANVHQIIAVQVDGFGGAGHGIAWQWLEATGTSAAVETYTPNNSNADDCIAVSFALNDSGDGYTPGYIDPDTTPSQMIEPMRLNSYVYGSSSVNISSTLSGETIDGFSPVNSSTTSTQYLSGFNPKTSISYTTINNASLAGWIFAPSGGVDTTWGEGLIMGWLKTIEAEDAGYINSSENGGMGFLIYDDQSPEEWRYWRVGGADAQRTMDRWTPAVIEVDDSGSTAQDEYATPDLTNVEALGFTQANSIQTNLWIQQNISLLNRVVAAGGSSTIPMDYTEFFQLFLSAPCHYAEKLGASSLLSYIPVTIGGGEAVYTSLDGMSLQFPKSYDTGTKDLNVHVADNKLGLTLDGNSGDVINITNSLISGSSKWHFIMASGLAGTYDLSGTTIGNAGTVTLRDISQDLDSMTFSECDTIALNDCALTNSTITKSTADVALDIDDVTECADLANLSFVDNNQSATAHSIELKATGTYTFDNFTFSGGGADASNTADVYNNSGGAVTINITNGGNTPTYKNGAGASTTISNAVTVTVTALDEAGSPIENARVLLEETGGTDILTGLTNASGVATTSYEGTYPQTVQGWVRKGSASTYYKQAVLAGSVTSSGYDVTVTMVADE